MKDISGVYAALVTPFDKKEALNEHAFRELINAVIGNLDGILVCGTTGEFEYLSFEERKRIYGIAREEVNKGKLAIAGTGAPSTRQAIELTKYAEEIGMDACLIVAPYFIKPSDKGLYEHFYQISRAVDLPIIIYNIPQTTGYYISRRVVEDLAELDNIIAVKDSSGNLTYTLELLEKVKSKINILIGHDEVVLPALASGCSGMILGSAQVFPEIWQALYKSLKDGNLALAQELQLKVQKLTRIFCRYGNMVPIKYALRLLGLNVGRARTPLKEGGVILHEDREEIKLELEKIGKLKIEELIIEGEKIPLEERFKELGVSSDIIRNYKLFAGTGTAGAGRERVAVDILAGKKNSPLARAFAKQFLYLRKGYEALPAILEPNLSVKPSTLIIPAVELRNLRQANIIYGPCQSAIAKAVIDSVEDCIIEQAEIDDYIMLAKVFVQPNALDRKILYHNFYLAAKQAIENAFKLKL
ncbi:MAG: 4-hydroxy-tetrahydrodipicolinate synthase [Candidatus Thermoplasmatota archaeon]|nr:4-hydroxy-tetrahydrodipicolinate synthase [Candidatus Thermoplasmatota archaeon]